MITAAKLHELNIEKIREEFPILNQQVNGQPLIYLDNAATTQKPNAVVNALVAYYNNYNANIHRGIHTLAEKATVEFEDTRKAAQNFINAREWEEVIFTKGTTEGINLVASTYGRANVKAGDEVVISGMEHHSNIVPWQLLCEEKKAVLKVIPLTENGELDLEAFKKLLSAKTKVVSVCHASNSLGVINPVAQLTKLAHDAGAVIVIDGAQAAPHLPIDVQALDCDFYAFSAHKMYGPTGCGVLYGKRALLEDMPPYQGGGEMISQVTFSRTTYADIPYKFEAGTPNIADISAFKQAIQFIDALGKENIASHEQALLKQATEALQNIKNVRLWGKADDKVSLAAFTVDGLHHFDIGMMLDARGIAVRTGHHCTQPIMDRYGIEGTVRASFAVYNTKKEVDQMAEALDRLIKMMK